MTDVFILRVHFHLQDMIVISINMRCRGLCSRTVAGNQDMNLWSKSPHFYESRASVQNEKKNERCVSVYINTLKTEPVQQNI